MKKLLIGMLTLASTTGFAFEHVKHIAADCKLLIKDQAEKQLYKEKVTIEAEFNLYDSELTRFNYSSGNHCNHRLSIKNIEFSDPSLKDIFVLTGKTVSTDNEGAPDAPRSSVEIFLSPKNDQQLMNKFLSDKVGSAGFDLKGINNLSIGKKQLQTIASLYNANKNSSATIALKCETTIKSQQVIKPLGSKFYNEGKFYLEAQDALFMTDKDTVCPQALYMYSRVAREKKYQY